MAQRLKHYNKLGYRGVFLDDRGKFRARLDDRWLGRFEDPATAARAYDKAAKLAYGDDARLNFPSEGEASSVQGPTKKERRESVDAKLEAWRKQYERKLAAARYKVKRLTPRIDQLAALLATADDAEIMFILGALAFRKGQSRTHNFAWIDGWYTARGWNDSARERRVKQLIGRLLRRAQ